MRVFERVYGVIDQVVVSLCQVSVRHKEGVDIAVYLDDGFDFVCLHICN